MIPPKYPNLYTDWDLQNPKLPSNKPKKGSNNDTITCFFSNIIRRYLIRWKAPFTQTHADRHLGNLLGLQAGIPAEVRAASMGHSVTMNETIYKKRQGIQTQIDVLTQSNKQAIDFTSGLLEAKRVIEKYPKSQVPIVELIAKIYQKSEVDIEMLLG
jgi:integrase